MIEIPAKIIVLSNNSKKILDAFQPLLSICEFDIHPADARILEKKPYEILPSLFIIDWDSISVGGLSLLKEIKRVLIEVPIIVISENRNVQDAIRVIQAGASDYLSLSADFESLSSLIKSHLDQLVRNHELKSIRAGLLHFQKEEVFIGDSPEIKKVMAVIERIAPLPTTVLLHGESGTGKEIMAQLLHSRSHIANRPFITVNLPSIPPNLVESVLFGHERGSFTGAHRRHFGKFELADGGTIFLDEIGDLHFDVQSKLLRVIQEGEMERVGGNQVLKVNVRVIAASKLDLKSAVKSGKFRDDLYYRLNVVPITLPPLRKRLEDLPGFCDIFIRRYADKFGKPVKTIAKRALAILKAYHWPGNIRELENLFERMIAIISEDQTEIRVEDIPLEYVFASLSERTPSSMYLDDALVQFERNLIMKTLRKHNWSRKETAKALGVSYGILKYKVRKLNIEMPGHNFAKRNEVLRNE